MPWRRAALSAHTLLHRPPYWPEPWSGFAAVLWSAISVCSAGDVTDRQGFMMLDFVAGRVLEVLGASLGVLQIAAVVIENHEWRKRAAFFSSAWWLLLTLSIVSGDPAAPSWGVYLCLALAQLVSGAALARRDG